MAIYGTAILAISLLLGLFLGKVLGIALNVEANVGGVGIAMLILIIVSDRLRQRGYLPELTQSGILYWSSIYIPIVVAMAASQDVKGAISGGPAAITAGVLVVLASFLLVPLITRFGQVKPDDSETESEPS